MTAPDSIPIKPLGRFDVALPDQHAGMPPIPGSKSLTNRALTLAALGHGDTRLHGVLWSDDTRVMFQALTALGITNTLDRDQHIAHITGCGGTLPVQHAELMLGNAGTATRFLTALCALGPDGSSYTIDGVPRMRQRPIGQLVDALRTLGARIDYLGQEGLPPLKVHGSGGTLGCDVTLGALTSSQYVSALAQIGPLLPRGLTISFDQPPISKPYVDMTVALMKRFGGDGGWDGDLRLHVPATGPYAPTDLDIEPDASNASYFLAAAALIPGSRCQVHGIGTDSLQGDAHFAPEVLARMGAQVQCTDEHCVVTGPDQLHGIDIDLNAMPDMAQTLACVAPFADGPTTIRNIGSLRVKETDRLAALETELNRLGIAARVDGDDLHVPPVERITPAAVDTYDDHRMAMSFALIGLKQPGVTINDPGCVNKTFPRYFDYLERLARAAEH